MENKLTVADICCYLPYGLKVEIDSEITSEVYKAGLDRIDTFQIEDLYYGSIKPLLRPMSMLYQTIVHDGKEEVPIVVLAKMAVPEIGMTELVIPKNDIHTPLLYCNHGHSTIEFYWHDNGCFIADGWECGQLDINQWKLMDYLASRLFDFRGLIEKGLAIKMEG